LGAHHPHFLEWDAARTRCRRGVITALLFPTICCRLRGGLLRRVKLVYWIGTLFANPHWVCKFVPFSRRVVVCRASRSARLGGRVVGAAAVVLCSCSCVGANRGLNARVRLSADDLVSPLHIEKRERPALGSCSRDVFYRRRSSSRAAYGATLLWPWKLDAAGYATCGRRRRLGCCADGAARRSAHRHPILIDELRPAAARIVALAARSGGRHAQAWRTSLHDDYGLIHWMPRRRRASTLDPLFVAGALALCCSVAANAGASADRVPASSSLAGAFFLRSGFPIALHSRRMLQYAWPPLLIFAFCSRLSRVLHLTQKWPACWRRSCVRLELTFYGDAFCATSTFHDWRRRDDPCASSRRSPRTR